METRYFYIKDENKYGKREDGVDYIFSDGKWITDSEHLISDRLIGYDPYEDDDSPYKIGNTSIMDQIREISEKEIRKILKLN